VWLRLFALGTLALCLATGCATKPAPLLDDRILAPAPPRAALQPSDGDLATRNLVRAALLTKRGEMDRSLATLEQIAKDGGEPNRQVARRIPLSMDLINATLDDPVEYRAACKDLRKHKDLDPRLESRLDECAADDYLRLARRRVWDTRETLWADTYNAVAEPLSRSLISGGILAPYYIATSVANYLARLNERDPFPVQLRQALVHRESFLARFPDSEEAPKVRGKVERASQEYARYRAKKLSFQAKLAMKNHRPRAARYLTRQALEFDPTNKKAIKIFGQSSAAIEREWQLRARSNRASLDTDPQAMEDDTSRSAALLLAGRTLARDGRAMSRSEALHDVGPYVLATAMHEAGRETQGFDLLRAQATRDPESNAMTRHAGALLKDPYQYPYWNYKVIQAYQRNAMLKWRILGPFAGGPRYRRLPRPVAWLMDLPALVNTIIFSPVRLILSPMNGAPKFKAPVALAAYRYLDRHPKGEHMEELAHWLYDYESKQRNWNSALRMADYLGDVDSEQREELVEKVVVQQMEAAYRNARRDQRNSILRNAAREYPDSDAGHMAGIAAREELENVSAQEIRMTRGFLIENPQVSGPFGLGIRPELIDGVNANGELHPRGVTFLGARYLEFEFLAESGNEDEPSIKVRRSISQERLARVVAIVDDTVHRNARVDPDMDAGVDARRDLFLERARLGLTEEPDMRAAAQSHYVYESARERYGMVRGRESILPFDLVLRGDFSSMGLAAFPRWRKPKETPDAFLYR